MFLDPENTPLRGVECVKGLVLSIPTLQSVRLPRIFDNNHVDVIMLRTIDIEDVNKHLVLRQRIQPRPCPLLIVVEDVMSVEFDLLWNVHSIELGVFVIPCVHGVTFHTLMGVLDRIPALNLSCEDDYVTVLCYVMCNGKAIRIVPNATNPTTDTHNTVCIQGPHEVVRQCQKNAIESVLGVLHTDGHIIPGSGFLESVWLATLRKTRNGLHDDAMAIVLESSLLHRLCCEGYTYEDAVAEIRGTYDSFDDSTSDNPSPKNVMLRPPLLNVGYGNYDVFDRNHNGTVMVADV
eukprot:PhF_6_TR30372/c0_g1_i2/m.44494